MADLAAIFRAEVARAGQSAPPYVDDPALAVRLEELCARGRGAHLSVSVDADVFVRHLAGCVARLVHFPTSLDDLAIEDLYLVCACLIGAPGAIAAFDARCVAPVRAALNLVKGLGIDRDEIEQQLRVRLLVGQAGAPPRIASYLGQGALGRWAAVVAQRLALSSRRASEMEAVTRDRAAIDAAMGWTDPAIVLAKAKFRGEFQRALADALASLDERGRLLLRMHFVNGLGTQRIATIYNVNKATAARWLQGARRNVASETQRLLRERVALDEQEVLSLAALIASQLDLSLSQILVGDGEA